MCQPIALVEILPIVQEMISVLLADSVDLDTVQVERDEEQHRETS